MRIDSMTYCSFIRMLSAIMLLSLLAGCSKSDRNRIVGDWEIADASLVSDQVSIDDARANDVEPKMSITFDHSGNLRTSTKMGNIDSVKEGTWKFLGYDPSTRLMQVECTLQIQATKHSIEFKDEKTIEWIPPNMAGTKRAIRFLRSKN